MCYSFLYEKRQLFFYLYLSEVAMARPVFCLLLSISAALYAQQQEPLRGYTRTSTALQRDLEVKFCSIPSTESLRGYMKRLSARPHHVGSARDRENAEWILSTFQGWGLDAHLEVFQVLFPTPRERILELVEPTKFVAGLQEPVVAEDPTSSQNDEQLPTYNAYSADGEVTAPLVYVNYGIPEDYKQLDRLGISVKGAIVIARYGASWRGIKPKVAAEHGAVGCIIYSDPREDGYFEGDIFPGGAWRPPDGVQRGSVMEMTLYPGDPLTPGIGATADAKRLPLSEARTLTKIPVLPISYADARPLLESLRGPVAPEGWRGALPITYHVGPGPARVHLKVSCNWDIKPIYDVIARIPGSEFPDEWIIRGNHHDAWVNGAQDPVSGVSALLEEARGFAELLKQDWKPKRTILYCAWDGEEEGLLGSTEWAEAHADELVRHAAVYINSDTNGRGFLEASGSHTLEKFINGVALDIPDPESGLSIWKRLQLSRIARGPDAVRSDARRRPDLRIDALGSGSDYTVFIDHLGIASLNLGFGGEDGSGIYHSIYDDYYWYTHFSDTEFRYGRALVQTIGTAVMRLAGADILPFDFTDLADTVNRYVEDMQKLLKDKQAKAREHNRQIEEGVFSAVMDPKEKTVLPSAEPEPPYLNFAPLENAAGALSRSADRYEKAFEKVAGNDDVAHKQAHVVNQMLIESERRLTDPQGLVGRPWFRHLLYAPGFYTGYGVKTLPGVREAIEQGKWQEAESEIVRTGSALEKEAALIDGAAAALEQAIKQGSPTLQ
jgi:N-acetylated-alpha-linked acidic dipeptidase